MATLIIEDGSIVANANSYVTVQELTDFAADRGVDTFTGDESELLIQAMDYLENQDYKGLKKTQDQPLQWPRVNVVIDSFYFPSDEIPVELKYAQMQIAMSTDAGNDPNQVIERKVTKNKVDVIEQEYADNAPANAIDPKVNMWLRKLVVGGSSALMAVKA